MVSRETMMADLLDPGLSASEREAIYGWVRETYGSGFAQHLRQTIETHWEISHLEASIRADQASRQPRRRSHP